MYVRILMKDETHIFILRLECSIHIWINGAYIKIYTYVRIIYSNTGQFFIDFVLTFIKYFSLITFIKIFVYFVTRQSFAPNLC